MTDPLILPVKPGSLSTRDIAALRKTGVTVIQHEDPGSLRLLRPHAQIDGSDLLACAMQALTSGKVGARDQREEFTRSVARAVLTRRGQDHA